MTQINTKLLNRDNFPDLTDYGYQIQKKLGNNLAGGRITYLANNIKTQQPVVIKQFHFLDSGSTWIDYETYQQEVKILQQLNHPNIPRYIDSFEASTSFCLVQEYKQASSLAQSRVWTSQKIQQIAIEVLKVLIYLQQQIPSVIHRDIKPENILVDCEDELKIYLVDFGFARFGSGEVALSSVVKGTLGFMPPEQIFNRELTEASDLYSLGATLICLLAGIKSSDIGNLVGDDYCFNLNRLPKLKPLFKKWLEKMVNPQISRRFSNASEALEALQKIENTTSLDNLKLISIRVFFVTASLFSLISLYSLISYNSFPFTAKRPLFATLLSKDQLIDKYMVDANEHYHKIDYEQALYYYDKALKIEPSNSAVWLYKGYTLRQLKRYEEAIAAIDKAIEINKNWDTQFIGEAWSSKGWILLYKLGRYEEAIIAYDKVLEIYPNYSDAIKNRKKAYNLIKKYGIPSNRHYGIKNK